VKTLARLRAALAALSPAWDSREAATLGVNDPELFTRAAKRPARIRVREAWLGTDYLRLLEAAALMPYPERCQTIAVISPKGGVGKTAITALLGSLIAFIRRDRTIAVDTNPDFGSLGRRLVPEHRLFIDDLLAGPLAAERTSPMDLAVNLGRGPDGLMVAPAPTDRERAQRLDESAYSTLFSKLAELAEVLVLDCGTGLDSPAARAALGTADQLVLVTDGEPDTASLITDPACKSLLEGLNVPVFLVANKLTARSRVDLGAFEREMSFARGIVDLPHDQAGADSLQRSRFSWAHRAPEPWRAPVRELAALIAMSWPTRMTSD
jgi:MinD-like ATPase involved in chromosome partitioning or flagellar assembly